MLVEAIGKTLRFRLLSGEEVVLRPGVPTVIPDPAAKQLLQKAGDHVRIVSPTEMPPIIIDPVISDARPLWWQGLDGRIQGPGRPEFLAKVGEGDAATFWVVVIFQGLPRWVRSDYLRNGRTIEVNQ